MSSNVTLGMLAANSAGYKDYARSDAFGAAQEADPYHVFTISEMVGYVTDKGMMEFAPGTSQAYSHTDMLLLYSVIEKKMGKSIAQLYNEYIFAPNQLNQMRSPTNDLITPEPVLHAYQSTLNSSVLTDSTFWSTSWVQGYGIITSNVADVGTWGHLLCSGALISPQSFHEQTRYQGYGSANPHFGYGVVVDNGWLFQNPSLNGYYGALACDPRTGYAVVAFSTLEENTVPTNRVAFDVAKNVANYLTPNTPITH